MRGDRRTPCLVIALALGCLLVPAPGTAQVRPQGFEKQGRFTPFVRALSRSNPGQEIGAAPSNPAFHVVSYVLDLALAIENENLAGRNRITLVMKAAADSVLLYQLALRIDSIIVDGVERPFSEDDAAERFTVHFGSVRQAGDTVRLDIAYRRIPGVPRPSERLGYYYFHDTIPGLPANLGYTMSEPSDARCWMPCYDEPWEKSTSEISVTVPAGYAAASNGKLLEIVDNGDGTVTWHWKESHQIAAYLMCVTASKYAQTSGTFARAPGDSVPVGYFAWAKDTAAAGSFIPTVLQMIANQSKLFGPYPWDKYYMASVTPFNYGGMEHQTMTTIHEALQTDQDVVVHELTHQWWGDLVTCGTWADIWLNEGFATYGEALWHESLGGAADLRTFMQSQIGFNLGSWTGAVYDPEGQGLYLFAPIVYSKGAWVLHGLRGAIGDSAFFRSLRTWRRLHSEQSAVTADFKAAVESVTGGDMSWFFNEWIYGPGWPVYAASFFWGDATLTLRIAQQQDQGWPVYTMPLQVRVYTGTGDTTLTVRDSLRTQDFSFAFPMRPDSVVLDPDGWVLHEPGTAIPPPPGPGATLPFSLMQNYPNPFNAGTTIVYDVPGTVSRSSAASGVRMTVYDILGRRVATPVNTRQGPGEYSIPFDGSSMASGVYFFRVEIQPPAGGTLTAVRKMMLVK